MTTPNQPEITDAEMAELERKYEAATKGEWRYYHNDMAVISSSDMGIALDTTDNNGMFVAAAHNALPALIARIERLEKEKAALAKALDEIDAAAEAYQSDESETYPHKVMGMIVSSAYVLAQVAKQEGK
jgi:uncharacterized protein (UPF0335 family)